MSLLIVHDREYPYAEDNITPSSRAQNATLLVLAKVPSLIELQSLGGSYEIVHQLWLHFTLTASRVNVDVTWSRDEVLVGTFLVLFSDVSMCISLLVLGFS